MELVDSILQDCPEWHKPLLEEYKPLKTNSKRESDICDIMEIYACRYPSSQEITDEFRTFLYCELSKVSDSEVPHTMDEKMHYVKTRWAYYALQIELSKL